jgi:hypothetical protein
LSYDPTRRTIATSYDGAVPPILGVMKRASKCGRVAPGWSCRRSRIWASARFRRSAGGRRRRWTPRRFRRSGERCAGGRGSGGRRHAVAGPQWVCLRSEVAALVPGRRPRLSRVVSNELAPSRCVPMEAKAHRVLEQLKPRVGTGAAEENHVVRTEMSGVEVSGENESDPARPSAIFRPPFFRFSSSRRVIVTAAFDRRAFQVLTSLDSVDVKFLSLGWRRLSVATSSL